MRHNINIIFKRRARSHYHNGMHRKLGYLAGARFSSPPAPSLPCLRRHPRSSRIRSKTRRKGVTPRPQMTPQRSFSLLPLSCELSRSCVMDEAGVSPLVFSSREREARYRYYVHSGHVSRSRSICVLLSAVRFH